MACVVQAFHDEWNSERDARTMTDRRTELLSVVLKGPASVAVCVRKRGEAKFEKYMKENPRRTLPARSRGWMEKGDTEPIVVPSSGPFEVPNSLTRRQTRMLDHFYALRRSFPAPGEINQADEVGLGSHRLLGAPQEGKSSLLLPDVDVACDEIMRDLRAESPYVPADFEFEKYGLLLQRSRAGLPTG